MLFAEGNIISNKFIDIYPAEDSFYVGGGLVVSDVENYTADKTFTLGGKVLGGYKFNENIATEVRVSYVYYEDDATLDMDIYVKPQYNGFYTLLGYSYIDTVENDSSLAYGVGFEVNGIFADATYRLESEETLVTLGYLYEF